MFKHKFGKKEDAPEGLREFLKDAEDKSGFEINLVPAARLDEFRTNNIKVSKERDELASQATALASILGKDNEGKPRTLDAFHTEMAALRETAQKVADGKIKSSDAIESELRTRTDSMKSTYETKLNEMGTVVATLKAEKAHAEAKLKQTVIDSAFTAACLDEKIGIIPQAVPDILRRAREIFVVGDDNSLVAKENGVIIRGEDGVTAMTPNEWLKGLRKNAGYYFKSSAGGGAQGGQGGEAKLGGLTPEAYAKLTPMQKLQMANRPV